MGGGTGEHLRFVSHSFSTYTLLDIAENTEGLERIASDPRSPKIKFVVADASSTPFSDSSFDRVVSTCVLHHVASVEDALNEIRRVSKNDAVVDLYLPCDPGLVYRWIRHWTSHLMQKKSMKLNWTEVKYLWALEHRNHYLGIYSLIRGVFRNDELKLSRHPLPILSWNFNLYSIIRITVAKGDINQPFS